MKLNTAVIELKEIAAKLNLVLSVKYQREKAKEELCELLIELIKVDTKDRSNKTQIVNEIVDVWITTIQLAHLYGIDECEERLAFKLSKLKELASDFYHC